MTQRTDAELKSDANTYINDNTSGDVTPSDVRLVTDNIVDSKINNDKFTANTILYATVSATPAPLTVGEQTLVGRKTGGNIETLSIDSNLTSTSASHDTIPSALAVKELTDNILDGTTKFSELNVSGVSNIGNIKISGNTIESTDEDGDINITPDGDGNVNIITNGDINLDSGDGRTKITRLITGYGTKNTQSFFRNGGGGTSDNSFTFQATKDILIVSNYYYTSNTTGSQCQFIYYCDSNATPVLEIFNTTVTLNSSTFRNTFTFAVKKDDYYRLRFRPGHSGSGKTTGYIEWFIMEIGV